MNAPRRAYAGPALVNACTVAVPWEGGGYSTVGGYSSDGERLGVSDAVADAYASAIAFHADLLSPCSNTGRIREERSDDAPAFVDFLSLTLRGLRRVLTRVRRQRPAPDGLDELRGVLFDVAHGGWDITQPERVRAVALLERLDCTGCLPMEQVTGSRLDRGLAAIARSMVAAVAPALVFGELTGKGCNGYTNHLNLYTHLGEKCGHIAVGGNAETVHVSLTGQGCRRVDMAALADALAGVEFSIGRLDATWDDVTGRYGTPRDAFTNYQHGGFTPARGARSKKVQFIDDGGTGAGCTFYLGDRKGRLLRIYDKDKQMGCVDGPRVRYEVQYMGAEFGLTLDHVRNPGTLLTQYPDLSHLPVDGTGSPAMRVQRDAQVSVDKLVAWLQVTCGAALTLLHESIGPSVVADLLHNDKTPRRLRSLADSRGELGELVANALLNAHQHKPTAATSQFLSAELRGNR